MIGEQRTLDSRLELENFLVEGTPTDESVETAEALASRLAGARGQYSIAHERPDGSVLLARDPLGVNKLFFRLTGEGKVLAANFATDLLVRGATLDQIWSVPIGHVVELDVAHQRLVSHDGGALPLENPAESELSDVVASCRASLEAVFEHLGKRLRDRPVFVALSGGLDSTTIASLAAEHIANVVAVTFSLDWGDGEVSEDMQYAERVARDLELPLVKVRTPVDELLDLLDVVLTAGQDWRDFNVHCGLVNAALGKHLASSSDRPRPVILTGDTMNEMMIDYQPEQFEGRIYYRLPAVSPLRLRELLVRGLDAGDREVGIFHRFGVQALQPYAWCAREYLRVGAGSLNEPMAKQNFARAVVGDRVPAYVLDRPKVRAQCGDADNRRGTMAALLRRGIDGADLKRRFCELVGADQRQVQRFMVLGRYRHALSFDSVAKTL